MSNQTILLLGGSVTQLNLIKKAKARGLRVILADYYANPPGAAYADVHEQVSTFDIDACLAVAKAHGVSAVATMGTDQPVLTAAVIAEALGLPSFIDRETAKAVTNKRVMKACFERAGVASAPYRLVTRDWNIREADGLSFPLVIKPADSQGQRGVYLLRERAELTQAVLGEVLSFSTEGYALVEPYLGKREVTSMGFLQDGDYHHIIVTQRNTLVNGKHIGVCTSHLGPCPAHFEHYDRIAALSRDASLALGVRNGPVYIQMLQDGERFVVNELAARVGGGYEDVMLPYLTGFDILEAVLDGALGLRPQVRIQPPDGSRFVSNQLLFTRPGTVADLTEIESVRALPFALSAMYNFAKGDAIGSIENATTRFGHCVVAGESMEALASNVELLYDRLQVTDTLGQPMLYRGRCGPIDL